MAEVAPLAATLEVADQALAPAQAMSLDQIKTLGWWLSLAERDDGTPEAKGAAASLRLAFASSLGLSFPAAVKELSFIHGRLNLSAQLVRAMAERKGYRVVPVERTDEVCTAALLDATTGEEIGRTSYTIEDARRAGLIRDRSSWKTAPGRMLWARASKRVIDDFAPSVSLGITTPEEEEEIVRAAPGMDVGEPPEDPDPEAAATSGVEEAGPGDEEAAHDTAPTAGAEPPPHRPAQPWEEPPSELEAEAEEVPEPGPATTGRNPDGGADPELPPDPDPDFPQGLGGGA